MNDSRDSKTLGIVGFLLLILSSSFLDVPMFGLLAMPVFIAGVICVIIYSLRFKKTSYSTLNAYWFSTFLIILGVLALSITMGYTGIKFAGYFSVSGSHDIADSFNSSSSKIILIILIVDFVATSIILLGMRLRSEIKRNNILLAWVILFLSVPLIVGIIKLLQLIIFHPN
jgi:hypothetical protein